jgi:hypothetical protein
MPDGTLPMQVDVFQLQQAEQWLKDTKAYIDNYVLPELRKIPGTVGNASTNPDDPTASTPQAGGLTSAPAGGSVVGLISSVGATHFGLFPSGRDVAARHAGVYNGVLTGLDAVSKDLDKAISATAYIRENYKNVDEVTAVDMKKFMTDPPYRPGAQQPGTQPTGGDAPDPGAGSNPGGSRSYYV